MDNKENGFIKNPNNTPQDGLKTMDEVNKDLEARIIEYLKDNPDFSKKVVNMFIPKKVKRKIKKGKLYAKLAPYVLLATLVVGGMIGAKTEKTIEEKNNVTYTTDFDTKYGSIYDAPIEVKNAYIEKQYDIYNEAVKDNPELKNEELENAIRAYESSINGGQTNYGETDELANSISDMTLNDGIFDTIPFVNSDYSKSIVGEDGSVYVPVKDKSTIEEDDILLESDGRLYKKGI